jgi:hypothetical protein
MSKSSSEMGTLENSKHGAVKNAPPKRERFLLPVHRSINGVVIQASPSSETRRCWPKNTKSFNLIDTLAVGVDRIQRNFEPLQRQVSCGGRPRSPTNAQT